MCMTLPRSSGICFSGVMRTPWIMAGVWAALSASYRASLVRADMVVRASCDWEMHASGFEFFLRGFLVGANLRGRELPRLRARKPVAVPPDGVFNAVVEMPCRRPAQFLVRLV